MKGGINQHQGNSLCSAPVKIDRFRLTERFSNMAARFLASVSAKLCATAAKTDCIVSSVPASALDLAAALG
jgi:hypothetical protein